MEIFNCSYFEFHMSIFVLPIFSFCIKTDLYRMKESKVWLILGAGAGLGPAAVKYLRANRQVVIPVDTTAGLPAREALVKAASRCGRIDFIINNANYHLFNNGVRDTGNDIMTTVSALKTLTPFLNKSPGERIINIPPKLCLATLTDQEEGGKLLQAMNDFLTELRVELQALNCGLHFLEPGKRLL